MTEQIKEMDGHPDYLISNLGYIISKERIYNNGKSETAVKSEKILKISTRGYVGIITSKRTISKKLKEWVAENFLECPKDFSRDFYSVFTRNGNDLDCRVENLYYQINDSALRAFDLEGNWLGDYARPTDFADETGAPLNSIYVACLGGQVTSDSYQFRSLKIAGVENNIKRLPSALNRRRSDTTPVAKYWKGKLICVYNSISDAADANEMTIEKVWESYERNKAIKGFLFKKIV